MRTSRNSNLCPACFTVMPRDTIYAGSLCARCSADSNTRHAERIADGDAASVIIERAAIGAQGFYFACEWGRTIGNGEDTPVETVAAGYSAHATIDGALAAMRHRHKRDDRAHVTGPHALETA